MKNRTRLMGWALALLIFCLPASQASARETVLLASAVRTAVTSTGDISGLIGKDQSYYLMIEVTLDGAAAAVTPHIEMLIPGTSTYVKVWTAAATIAATGIHAYLFTVGVAPAAAEGGLLEATQVPVGDGGTVRVTITVADTDALTYSLGLVTIKKQQLSLDCQSCPCWRRL